MDSKSGAIRSYYRLDAGTYLLNVSASDGRFTRYGLIEVKVVLVTDEMMSEALEVSIDGITAGEFVSIHQRSLERAVTSASNQIRWVIYYLWLMLHFTELQYV